MLKRLVKFFIFLLAVVSFSISVNAENLNTYTDSTTGVSFTIPQGWYESPLTEEREFIKVKYLNESNDGASIQFGYGDLWSEMSESEKVGHSRSEINHSAVMESFTKEEILQMMGYDSLGAEIDSTYYNGNEYLKITINTEMSFFDVSTNVTMITLLRFDNGYGYQFVYGGLAEYNHFSEFETMMNTVKYKTVEEPINEIVSIDDNGGIGINFPNLILSLVITIAVYSLPIIIYRYGIKKQALPKKKAKKITIIYGIIAFFVMSILVGAAPGGAILLWSFVNYEILIKPNKYDIELKYNSIKDEVQQELSLDESIEDNDEKDNVVIEEELQFVGGFEISQIEEPECITETIIDPIELVDEQIETTIVEKEVVDENSFPKVLFCRKCGTKLFEGSDFCHKCGVKGYKGGCQMICKQCNNNVPNDSEYCPFCGNVVEKEIMYAGTVSEVEKGYTYLELKEWKKAKEIFDFAIVNNNKKAKAYIGRLLAKLKLSDLASLTSVNKKLTKFDDFKMAIKYADDNYKQHLKKYYSLVEEKINQKKAKVKKRAIISSISSISLIVLLVLTYFVFIPLGRFSYYQNLLSNGKIEKATKSYSNSKWFEYDVKAEELFYNQGVLLVKNKDYKNAEFCFKITGNFKDSKDYYNYCKAQNLLAKNDLESYNYFTKCKDFLDSKNILDTNECFVLVNKLQGKWKSNPDTYSSSNGVYYGAWVLETGEKVSMEINVEGINVFYPEFDEKYTINLSDKELYIVEDKISYIDFISEKTIMYRNIEWDRID